MHSLSELNNFSSSTISFLDERPFALTITPPSSPQTATVFGAEGNSVTAPCPYIVTTLQSANANITALTVNVSAYANANVTWTSVPASVTVSNLGGGVYRASGWRTVSELESVLNPSINFGTDASGNLTYTSNLRFTSNSIFSWTTTAVIADTGEINTGSLVGITYNEDEAITFNSGLLVTDTNPSGTYNIVISKSDPLAGNLSSVGSGGTSTYSANVLTIAGNKTQVNSHLANITYTPTPDFNDNFTLNYAVTNVSSSEVNYATQSVTLGFGNDEIINMYYNRYYVANKPNEIFATQTPYITDVDPTDPFYTISFAVAGGIGFFESDSNLIARPNWNDTTKTYSFTGTRAQCDDILSSIKFYPTKDTTSTATITYTQRKNGIFQVSQTFNLIGSANSDPIPGTGLISYENAGLNTFTPTYEQVYILRCDVLLVGPGGGFRGSSNGYTGGPAAGEVKLYSNINLRNTAVSGVLNYRSGTGDNTIFGSLSALRGQDGGIPTPYIDPLTGQQRGYLGANGGSSGMTGNIRIGGSGWTTVQLGGIRNPGPGGGGGGASGAGGNATSTVAGAGGAGVSSNFTGNTVVYGVGAKGQDDTNFSNVAARYTTTPGSGGYPGGAVYIKFYV